MSSPVFTVIITTYNRKDLLPRAIRSVLGQTFRDFELLVIDNGSTDGTESVVRLIRDGRIKYIRNPEPSGSCDAPRNLGIRMASGSLTSLLDDDDIWYADRLEKVKRVFDRDPQASAVCHYENLNMNGTVTRMLRHGPWSSDMHERLLYEGNCLSTGAITIRTDLLKRLGGFDLRKEFYGAADYELWIRMAAAGAKIDFIEEPLGEFFLTGHNFSASDPLYGLKTASLVKMHIESYERRGMWSFSKKGSWRMFQLYFIAGRGLFTHREYTKAARYLLLAMLIMLRRPSITANLLSNIKEGGRGE